MYINNYAGKQRGCAVKVCRLFDSAPPIVTFPYFCAFYLKRFIVDFRPEEEQDKLSS